MVYLLNTDCGVSNHNTIIYLSVLATVLSFFCGFLYRLLAFVYRSRLLKSIGNKVEVKIGERELEQFGFKQITKMMTKSKNCQALTLTGTGGEYFNCTLKRMRKLRQMVEKMKARNQIEFLELSKCKLDHPLEAQVVFSQILQEKGAACDVKYLTIQRCRLAKEIHPVLITFLNENESLVRFSFVMNNDIPIEANDFGEKGKLLGKEGTLKTMLLDKALCIEEDELDQNGMQSDMDVLRMIDAATLHPSLQIIQVAQCLGDYYQAYQFLQATEKPILRATMSNSLKVTGSNSNENLESQESQRRSLQKEMFQRDKQERAKIYESIYENLTINQLSDGISSLRRLEIRFMPLDPLLVEFLFSALKKNVILQELILTDDALTHCSITTFGELFEAMRDNCFNSLTLLDFSRNFTYIDDDIQIHKGLIEAISTQKQEWDKKLLKVADNNKSGLKGGMDKSTANTTMSKGGDKQIAFLETLKITSKSD